MLKKLAPMVFIFTLLFAFFGNDRGSISAAHSNTLFSFKGHAAGFAFNNATRKTSISYSKHVFKQDHIKVRYMGGECTFSSSPIPENHEIYEYAELQIGFRNANFIPSDCGHISQLRGPPPAFVI